MPKSIVAVVRARPESILSDIERVCELAGLGRALDTASPTLLVPSAVRHTPAPAGNSTPWQLEGAARELSRLGASGLGCIEAGAGLRWPLGAAAVPGCEPVLRGLGLAALGSSERVEYRPKQQLHVLHRMFPEGLRLPRACFGKNLVHLPALYTEPAAGVGGVALATLSLLSLGRLAYTPRRLQRALVDWLAIQKEIQSSSFALIDATSVGIGPTPGSLAPLDKGLLLASRDLVAADAVAATLLGFDPLRIEYLRLAYDDGLGVAAPADIETVGDDLRTQRWGLGSGGAPPSRARALLASAAFDPLRKLATRAQLDAPLAVGREALAWARHERAAFDRWQAESPWGALHARYQRGPLQPLTPAASAPRASAPESSGVRAAE